MVQQRKPARRLKKAIPEMMPVKQWISLPEACSYMDMSINNFMQMAIDKGLTISVPTGKKKFFKVSQLNALLENSIIA